MIISHLIWFVASVWIWQKPYSYDSVEYIQMAANLKQGLYYSGNAQLPLTEHFMTLRPPLYSAFILLCWTFFGQQTWVLLLFQNIISIATCFLVRNTFRKIFPDAKHDFLYWLLILLYPMQMVFANMVFCDVQFQFFLMLYLNELLLFIKDRDKKRPWKMGLWLIAGVFTKPILYPFLFIHAVFTLFFSWKRKSKWIIATALLPLCLVLLYGVWNEKRTGIFHISSVQSYNLLEYNVSEFYRYKYGPELAQLKMDTIKKQLDHTTSFKERYQLSATIASQRIKAEPVSYALFHIVKSVQLFFDPNKLEFDIFSRRFHYINQYQESFSTALRSGGIAGALTYLKGYPFLLLLLITPITGFFRLLGLILFLCNRKYDPALRLIIAIFVAYFVLITGPVANARYFLPLLMLSSACSWVAYQDVWQKRKSKNNLRNATNGS